MIDKVTRTKKKLKTIILKPLRRTQLSIDDGERSKLWERVEKAHSNGLSESRVVLPEKDSAAGYQLVACLKYDKQLVHKDDISYYVKKHIKGAGKDQQVRHLGTQKGWNILNKGDSIPGTDDGKGNPQKVPSGYHLLLDITQPKPAFLNKELKRVGRVGAGDFDQLKAVYGGRCASCGSKDGEHHLHDRATITQLQRGHKDPSKPLNLDNTIPQCQLCNQTSKDDFVFDDKGRVIALGSAAAATRSSETIRRVIYERLKEEFEPKQSPIRS